MKKMIIALAVLLTFPVKAEIVYYETKFEGLQVGVSTIADVIRLHGSPISKKSNSNNVRYSFRRFDITIQDSTGKINTIIIFDKSYKDPNGIKPGDSIARLVKVANIIMRGEGYAYDPVKGVIYWTSKSKVTKIVLPHALKLRKQPKKSLKHQANLYVM